MSPDFTSKEWLPLGEAVQECATQLYRKGVEIELRAVKIDRFPTPITTHETLQINTCAGPVLIVSEQVPVEIKRLARQVAELNKRIETLRQWESLQGGTFK